MKCYCGQSYVKQDETNVHHNLEAIVSVAKHHAEEHNCNYNIIRVNPQYEIGSGSTYEYVADSYFKKKRPNVKLLATTIQLGVLPYDVWIPYTEYEKQECDIKLKDGTIIKHCYPNAGSFSTMCADSIDETSEEEVAEIMYRKYYVKDLCIGDCNETGVNKRLDPAVLGNPMDSFIEQMSDIPLYAQQKELDRLKEDLMLIQGPQRKIKGKIVDVRTEPKIGRNSPCPCGSGRKHKKCCINN